MTEIEARRDISSILHRALPSLPEADVQHATLELVGDLADYLLVDEEITPRGAGESPSDFLAAIRDGLSS